MSAVDLQALPFGQPPIDSTKFCCRQDAIAMEAGDLDDRISDLASALNDLRVEESPVRDALIRRRMRTNDVQEVLEEWRNQILALQPTLDDKQRQIDLLKRKIPKVSPDQKAEVPKLLNELLFNQIELERLQEQSQDLISLLESESFQTALEYFKAQTKKAWETVSSWSQNATKVVAFEEQSTQLVSALGALHTSSLHLHPRVRHAVKSFQKTTLLTFIQATGELDKKIGINAAADRSALQGRIQQIQKNIKAQLPELDEQLRTLEEQLEPLRGEVKTVANGVIEDFCQKAALRDALYFNPQEFMTYYRYYTGYYKETQIIACRDLALVAKGIQQLLTALEAKLKLLCLGNFDQANHRALIDDCEHYKNILSSLQTRLKEHLLGKERQVGLYQTEFNPMVPRVIEYADALSEKLFEVRRMLGLLRELSSDAFGHFFEAKREAFTHLCPPVLAQTSEVKSYLEAVSLFSAMGKLQQLKVVIESPDCQLLQSVAGRFHHNTVRLLCDALSDKASIVLSDKDLELQVFNNIVSLDPLESLFVESEPDQTQLPLSVRANLVKHITKLAYVLPKDALDMEIELVLYRLRTEPSYRAPLERSLENEQFRATLQTYQKLMENDRLSDEVLERASALFKFINDTLIKRPPNPLAFARAWQAYLEFASTKPDSRALLELKRLAAMKLQALGIEKYFFVIIPEAGDKSLQECASLGAEILNWPQEAQRRLLLRALYAAIWAKDEEEKTAAHKIVCIFLESDGLEALIRIKRAEFCALIFENTINKLLNREFHLITPKELKLFREEGPVHDYLRTKTHPIEDDRINDVLYNIVLCMERFSPDHSLRTQAQNMPTVKVLLSVMGDDGFLRWFSGKHQFASHIDSAL